MLQRILLFGGLIVSLFSQAQIGTGTWRMHVATTKAIDIALSEKRVFTAFENGLFILDISSNEEEKELLNAVDGLSDIELNCLYYDEVEDAVYIGYKNGNIDKWKNGSIYNIPAVKMANIPNSKQINRFERNGNYIYVATDFAVIVLNPAKNEVKDTYYPTNGNEKINDLAFLNDTLFALAPSRLLKASLNNPTIPDASAWTQDYRMPTNSSGVYKEIESVAGTLFTLLQNSQYGQDSLFRLTSTGNAWVSQSPYSLEINSINKLGDDIAVNLSGGVFVYDGTTFNSILGYNNANLGVDLSVSRSAKSSDGIWVSDFNQCLAFMPTEVNIKTYSINGSKNNAFYQMDWSDGKLSIASGRLLMKLPAFSKNGVHSFEEEKWSIHDWSNTTAWQNKNLWDILDVSINPKNKEQIAVCSYSEEPLTVFTGDEAQCYNASNSTLVPTEIGNGWTHVSDVCYDSKGNLWALNGYCQKPLNLLDKTGTWQNFDCGTAARNIFTTKMIMDFDNIIWFASQDNGMFGYNTNGTIDDPSDDKYVHISSGSLAGDLPSKNVTALAADFQGEIWVGTDAGFGILYNASSSFDAQPGDYNIQRVKVKYEGNVEYVLGNTHITDIEVDGGNRKWIATANAGILLLSADGSEILEQHTTQNSPLISDNIFDLKLDQNTGELFIITDKGLVSYRSTATYEDPEYASTTVFPNPVRPNYFGPVTIQGIRYNSDVKITDVAGNLVYKTTSNGGTATWNCQTLDGQKVASGVYFIWTATNEGKDKKVGKVLVVR